MDHLVLEMSHKSKGIMRIALRSWLQLSTTRQIQLSAALTCTLLTMLHRTSDTTSQKTHSISITKTTCWRHLENKDCYSKQQSKRVN